MNFSLDHNHHTVEVKSKWMGWSIKGLSLDGNDLDFFHHRLENAEEMELNGIALKIDYEFEYKDPESGILEYVDPNKISSSYFQIVKPSDYKLTVKVDKNLTGKDRLIKIHVGDGNYFGSIDVLQSGISPN